MAKIFLLTEEKFSTFFYNIKTVYIYNKKRRGGRKMIKAIFFDIDGTLIPMGEGKIPEETKLLLRKLRQKGIKLFLATGRDYYELGDLRNETCFDAFLLINGQICILPNQTCYYKNPLGKEDTKILKEIFDQGDFPMLFVEEDRIYINYQNDFVRQTQKEIGIEVAPEGRYLEKEIYQAIFYANEQEEKQIMKHLPNCQAKRWNSYGMDVIAKNGGKEYGIKHTLEYFDIKLEQTMAFGDGDNDASMLSYVGIGVAMGNATRQAKQAADYITDDVKENGLLHALEHFHVI